MHLDRLIRESSLVAGDLLQMSRLRQLHTLPGFLPRRFLVLLCARK
jgi:hypothetical protein